MERGTNIVASTVRAPKREFSKATYISHSLISTVILRFDVIKRAIFSLDHYTHRRSEV